MGMAFMSTLAITGTITITVAADGTLITAALPVTQYKVEIARPTRDQLDRVMAITAKCNSRPSKLDGLTL